MVSNMPELDRFRNEPNVAPSSTVVGFRVWPVPELGDSLLRKADWHPSWSETQVWV
jgi:hypothetical protein